jgi:hypothetical protein
LTDVLKEVIGEEGKAAVMEKLYDLAMGKGRRPSYFPALKYLIDRIDGEPIKAITAAVETGELPVVLLREKRTVQDGEDKHDEHNSVGAAAETGAGAGERGL